MPLLLQQDYTPEGITIPNSKTSKYICHILKCSLEWNLSRKSFVHWGVLIHHHAASNECTQILKWCQAGKPKGKVEHNTPVHHICTKPSLSESQNLISAAASSRKWEKGLRVFAAYENESTPCISPRELEAGICFILKESTKTPGYFLTAAML